MRYRVPEHSLKITKGGEVGEMPGVKSKKINIKFTKWGKYKNKWRKCCKWLVGLARGIKYCFPGTS
jgi:hypothetical protein